jgi:hypothetical protein
MGWLEDHTVKQIPGKKATKKDIKEAQKLRNANQKVYDSHKVEKIEVDGVVFRSRLEALWVAEFENCDSLHCVECVKVPLWITGPYGVFLGDYTPDLVIYNSDGSTSFVELKPNHKLAMADDRQKRALELNPAYRFVVIGGYPYSQRGVTVRMLTGKKESVNKNVKVPEVLKFLGCE